MSIKKTTTIEKAYNGKGEAQHLLIGVKACCSDMENLAVQTQAVLLSAETTAPNLVNYWIKKVSNQTDTHEAGQEHTTTTETKLIAENMQGIAGKGLTSIIKVIAMKTAYNNKMKAH